MALKAIWDGQNLSEVCREHQVRRQTLVYWHDSYLHGGFAKLLERAPVHREQRLSEQRQRIVRYMLLHKTPANFGVDSYQWTADRMRAAI